MPAKTTLLRERLCEAIVARLSSERRADLPQLCNELTLPEGSEDAPTKRTYIDSRLAALGHDDASVATVAERFLDRYSVASGSGDAFQIEELLWATRAAPAIPKRYRRELARACETLPICGDGERFIAALARLFILDGHGIEAFFTGVDQTLRAEIERHVLRNPDDWGWELLFEKLGALDVTDRRFACLLEALCCSDVRPDEAQQRQLVARMNDALAPCGVDLRETGDDGGYPSFSVSLKGAGASGRPKNLIFASAVKPDLRFRDAINNDVEIVEHADKVLVYDRPIPAEGLLWRDLQAWWAERHVLDPTAAKRSLYKRLYESLPRESPPQRLLFQEFFRAFGAAVPSLPALLPEVWLHYDPRTVTERGRDALLAQRMDFLLLFSHHVRVVIEVDGIRHYSDSRGHPDPSRYAATVAADRELRLLGYEVYRFGGAELQGDSGRTVVKEFFRRLLARHHVSIGT